MLQSYLLRMDDATETTDSINGAQILFSSTYGGFPRFIWFACVPFMLLISGALFADAVWFDGRFMLESIQVPPRFVGYVVCPVIWCLCGMLVVLEVYRQRNPQFVLVSTWGVRLPKGRFTAENMAIAWDDLFVRLEATNLKGWRVYEFHFEDVGSGESARISSLLFRRNAEFETFATVLGEQIGREWPITRRLPSVNHAARSSRT